MKKIALITVDYNGHADTLELLQSFSKVDTSGFETAFFVIDNGSDTPLELSPKFSSFATLIQTGKNLGFAGGYNRGFEYALEWGADYFFIINNDTLFNDSKILSKLESVLRSDDKIALASPKILFAPGFEFHKDKYSPQDEGKVIWYAGGHFDWGNVMGVHRGIDEVDAGQYDRNEQVESITGCCFMVKREVVGKGKVFDEKLFAYFEDGDWTMRLASQGWQTWYCGKTSIFHKVSRTAGIGSAFTDHLLTRNRLYFGMKYAPPRTRFALMRESLRLLITGRPAQRQGVLSYLSGKHGPPSPVSGDKQFKYPVKLSVVILNYKTLDLTRKLLHSIYNRNSGIKKVSTEIILIDNASEDGCEQMVAKHFPRVRFIQNQVNTGFAGGCNQGIRYSRGEYVLLLNSDIEVREEGFSRLVAEAERRKGKAVTAGKLWFPDGTLQNSCFLLPTVWGAIKEYFLGQAGSYFMSLPRSSQPTRVEGAVMACFLIPRRVINQVGDLDEGSFMYFEDVEYCRRLKQAGIPIYFCPSAEFTHYHGASSKQIGIKKSQEFLRKGSYFYHGPLKYYLLWAVLWLGQKWNRVTTPQSRWKQE